MTMTDATSNLNYRSHSSYLDQDLPSSILNGCHQNQAAFYQGPHRPNYLHYHTSTSTMSSAAPDNTPPSNTIPPGGEAVRSVDDYLDIIWMHVKGKDGKHALGQVSEYIDGMQREMDQVKQELEQELQIEKSSTKRSAKLPDPPVFTNGEDPAWDEWHLKILNKFKYNWDHFPSMEMGICYLFSRLGGEASRLVYARLRKESHKPYTNIGEILEHLASVYKNPDPEGTARLQFGELQMGTDSFASFYSRFMMLSSYLNLDEETIAEALLEKLSPRLRDAYLAQGESISVLRNSSNTSSKEDEEENWLIDI